MNKEIFGGSTYASATSVVIPVTPSYATNLAIAQVYLNINTGVTGVTCTHSTVGALTPAVTLTTDFGQYASFRFDNLPAGNVTLSWSGGGYTHYASVVIIEGSNTLAWDTPTTGSGSASVSILSAGSATDHYAFLGQRFAAAAPTADAGDAELNSAFGNSLGVSEIYESWTVGDTADWTISGGNVWTGVSYLVTSTSAQTLSSPTDPIPFSSTGNTVTANGFSANLTSLTDQTSSYSYTISNQSGGDPNTVTFEAFPLFSLTEASGGVVGPILGAVTLVGTYLAETATVATNTSLPAGYSSVVLSGSSNVAGTVGYGLNEVHGVTAADGWPVIFPTGSNTIVNADGTLQTDSTDLYFYMQNPATYTWYAVRFLFTTDAATRTIFNIGRVNLSLSLGL